MKHLGMVLDRPFLSASPFEGQSTAIPESGQLLQRGNCFRQRGLSRFKSGISSESMKTTENPGKALTSVSSLRSDSNVRLFVQKHEGGWIVN